MLKAYPIILALARFFNGQHPRRGRFEALDKRSMGEYNNKLGIASHRNKDFS